jgi:hypothetical protein
MEYWQAVLGIVVLLIILFLPGGLVEGSKRLLALVRGRGPDRDEGESDTDVAEPETTATRGG